MKTKLDMSISHDRTFPVEVNIYNFDDPVKHWHVEMELFFVLSGTAEIIIEDSSFLIQAEDVVLINSNELHQISTAPNNHCEILSLRFHIDRFSYINHSNEMRFDLNSAGNTHASRYDFIRYLIAQFIKINSSGEHTYKTLSMFYAIYSHLIENFLGTPLEKITTSQKHRERISAIISYIETHYTECLSLSAIAKSQNLSAPYFASFFERNTGKTFLTFYNEIRLMHAVDAMLTTDESLESIAISNGFTDSRSFVALFKKKYDMLPSTYRKQQTQNTKRHDALGPFDQGNAANQERSRKSVEQAGEFHNLKKYLNLYQNEAALPSLINSSTRVIDAGTISFNTESHTLQHHFHKLMCVGSARQFLYTEVQDMIRIAQKEIHYEYVKFHGLLSDEMMVYTEKSDSTPVYTFTLVDKVMDFLLSVGLRPLCQLSFMPLALASDPSRMVDMHHFNTSPPKDMNKWLNLIDTLIRHFITRYGINEVRQWLFCVWNEPDETVNEFSWSDRSLFFRFYELTYKTVKAIDPAFIIGTPSLLLSITEEEGWAADFFRYCRDHDCPPDFLNIHYYDNTMFESDMRDRQRTTGFSAENMNKSFPLSVDPYAFLKFINNIKLLLKRYHMKSIPVYLTEWNLTISHRDLINDTCFKACYLIKNLLENYDRLDSFGYWCLTDFIEELPLPDELYHGGLGMFTYNGIPKAHYHAFRFLNNLDDNLIGKGDGYFITKSEQGFTLILYNYEHYSKLFAAGIMSDITNANRYAPFAEMNTSQFMVQFIDIPHTRCMVKEMFINQLHGSSYDAWTRMGAQPLYYEEELNLLRQQSQPGMYLHQETIEQGMLTLHAQLAPLEVRLIEVAFLC